jgi:hypothetical protein
MRPALVLLIVTAACGHPADPDGSRHDAGATDGDSADDANGLVDAATDAPHVTSPDAAKPDAFVFPATLDLKINCRNDCVLVANPASVAVPAGTKFTVNWINTGDTDCDVAKIDQFNQVPIIIGLEPGTSYHDTVREWCGPFTGTFNFRISICTIPSYIPVDCSAP